MSKPRLVVVYYGRFQPPHIGHIGVYKELCSKFGKQNVYIGTSNVVEKEKSPLPFKWKKKLLMSLGVPSNHIIQTKQNYNNEEVEEVLDLDSENTVFIVAIGGKDSSRLKEKYFEKYSRGIDLLPMSDEGYYYVIPNIELDGKVISATNVRAVLRKNQLAKKDYDYLKKTIGADRGLVDNIKPLFESVILEGGRGGHMSHPYEDLSMSFSEMKQMIDVALTGEISKQEVSEKVDGQNLFASIINGEIRFARNKTQMKNSGEQSMTIDDVKKKWSSAPQVAQAFTEGALELQRVFSAMDGGGLNSAFKNGKNWVNLEVIWNINKNVIDYDRNVIVFHNVQMTDEDGSTKGIDSSAQKKLFSMVAKFNETQKTAISTPVALTIKGSENFSTNKKYFESKLSAFMSKQKMKYSNNLGDWLTKYWTMKINGLENSFNHKLSKPIKNKIINRLVYDDKSYKLTQMRKDIGFEPMYKNIEEFLKQSVQINRQETKQIEYLFLELGAEVLQNVEKFLAANPSKTVQALRTDIARQIRAVRSSNNIEDLEKMREQLKIIQAIGGFDKIVPSEGIVFKWNNKTYKLTGVYAPINQLMGIGRFKK